MSLFFRNKIIRLNDYLPQIWDGGRFSVKKYISFSLAVLSLPTIAGTTIYTSVAGVTGGVALVVTEPTIGVTAVIV